MLTKESFTAAYGCRSCGHTWWSPEAPPLQTDALSKRTVALREVHDWLRQRRNVAAVEPNLLRLHRFGYDARGLNDSIRTLPRRWADVMNRSTLDHFSVPRIPVDHLKLPIVELNGNGGTGLDDAVATLIYRTLRRHLERRVLKYHRSCIAAMGKSLWWNSVHREVEADGICQYAYAYLLWRMVWEQVEVLRELFSNQQRLWHDGPSISCDWIPLELPRNAAARLLGLECIQTYDRCMSLAIKMQGEGRLLFPIWQLAGNKKIEWLFKQCTDNEPAWLHWWWRSDNSSLHTAPRHSKRHTRRSITHLNCLAC